MVLVTGFCGAVERTVFAFIEKVTVVKVSQSLDIRLKVFDSATGMVVGSVIVEPFVIVFSIVIVRPGSLIVCVEGAIDIVAARVVGKTVSVLSIVFVSDAVSVTVSVGDEIVLVATAPPSTATTE